MATEEKIIDGLKKAGKPVRPGELAELIGEDKDAVSKELGKLKKIGTVISPKRCFYSLPE